MRFDYYKKFVGLLVIGGGLAGALCFFIVTMLTFYEVVARYVLKSPTTWSLDCSIYLVMWGTLLGAAYTLKWHGHVGVEVLVAKFSKMRQRQLKIIVYTLMLLFCIILAWTGMDSCIDAYRFHEVTLSYIRTPLYIPMFSIVAGSVLLILEIVSQLIEMIQRAGAEE